MGCEKTSWATFYAVAAAIVRGLGISPTAVNVQLMGAWMYAEHGAVGTGSGANPWGCWDAENRPAYNPIDSILVMPGSQPFNCLSGGSLEPPCNPGVQAYISPAQGIQAAVETIQQGRVYPYANVLQGLTRSNPATFWDADWGAISGGSASAYSARLQQVFAQLPPVPPSVLAQYHAVPSPKNKGAPIPRQGVGSLPWLWIGLGSAVGVGAGWYLHTHPASFPRRVWRRYLG